MQPGNIEVLCVGDYFLPGFLGGGPIRTLDNMRKQLTGKVTLSVFTRDRDLGSVTQYAGIEANRWLETHDGPIYYASPDAFGIRGLRQALAAGDFEIVYLNSFFSPQSSILLYLNLRKCSSDRPILIAPRGEFSIGALAVKKHKKLAFLTLVRLLGLYRDVFWHASTPIEVQDILRQFPDAVDRILVAPDPVLAVSPDGAQIAKTKEVGHLRIAFISRISPMKNLDGLIRMLETVQVPVVLDIFGPIEDETYWKQCARVIAILPDNIQVNFHGPIAPDAVSSTFARYDLFAFPTQGENFGHVIFEALRSGTPVLISDQTPWPPDEFGAVTVIPLQDVTGWRHAIRKAAERTSDEQTQICAAAIDYANRYLAEEGSLRANLDMFRVILQT
jgi:glycosyltransferase involved in cell wall biosynthesis